MTSFFSRFDLTLVCLLSMLVMTRGLNEISPTLSSSSSKTVFSSLAVVLTPIPTPTPLPSAQPTTAVKACDASPCKNNGVCTNLPPNNSGFKCSCAAGWGGTICDQPTRSVSMDIQILEIDTPNLKITPNSPLEIQNLLTDPTTQLFKDACAVMTALLQKSLRADGTLTTEKIVCKRFYFASLHIEYILELPENSTDSVTTVQNAAKNGFQITSTANGNNAVVIDNTLSTADLNECLQPTGYCDVSAKCINTDGSYMCTCESGYQLIDRSKCVKNTSKNDEDILIIVLIVVFSGLFLLLILLVVILALRRRRRLTVNKRRTIQVYDTEEPVVDYGFPRMRVSAKPRNYGLSTRGSNMKNVAREDHAPMARGEQQERVFEVYYN